MLALAIGLGAGAVAAFVLARASLRPLRRLAAAVARVEETALDRRLDEEGLPRDLRPLAASFNDLLGRVESAFGRQRAFVARASHALRTPATGILARAEVALRRERSEAEYREALADVAVLARESADTVTRMLAVMRIDDPTRQLQLVTLRLAEVADEAKRLFAPRATLAGVGLRWDVPDDAELTADRDALRELLDVLLDNALRYTPAGGEIGLRVSVAGDATELEVWDTGPGIPPAEREQVFERFYRGSAAEKTGAAGSGLGLAIARSVVQAHGATIALADRAGGGARVLVRFPTSPPSLMSGGAHRPRGR
ncbi:MAG: HAMP domain-containing protein [Deltaproteobacteria bacterium]|nr:HAMP domain-containing protein [Kofleriaceae bacterium]